MNLNSIEYYYIRNAQSDIIGLFDNTGAKVVSYTYDSWGKLISIDGSLKDTVGVKNPYRYRGYRYDSETGLYYLQSRYYNPELGRFINADVTAGKVGTLLSHNVFAYSFNNPVNMDDPSGNWPKWINKVVNAVKKAVKKTVNKVKEIHYNRNQYNNPIPNDQDQAENLKWKSINPKYHQNNTIDNKPNTKYTDVKDGGHLEVVFYSNGQVNNTPEDMATYNFWPYKDDGNKIDLWGHRIFDVYPYYLWGNSPEDTTTMEQRKGNNKFFGIW